MCVLIAVVFKKALGAYPHLRGYRPLAVSCTAEFRLVERWAAQGTSQFLLQHSCSNKEHTDRGEIRVTRRWAPQSAVSDSHSTYKLARPVSRGKSDFQAGCDLCVTIKNYWAEIHICRQVKSSSFIILYQCIDLFAWSQVLWITLLRFGLIQ